MVIQTDAGGLTTTTVSAPPVSAAAPAPNQPAPRNPAEQIPATSKHKSKHYGYAK